MLIKYSSSEERKIKYNYISKKGPNYISKKRSKLHIQKRSKLHIQKKVQITYPKKLHIQKSYLSIKYIKLKNC
jgi:hypothetical protein